MSHFECVDGRQWFSWLLCFKRLKVWLGVQIIIAELKWPFRTGCRNDLLNYFRYRFGDFQRQGLSLYRDFLLYNIQCVHFEQYYRLLLCSWEWTLGDGIEKSVKKERVTIRLRIHSPTKFDNCRNTISKIGLLILFFVVQTRFLFKFHTKIDEQMIFRWLQTDHLN